MGMVFRELDARGLLGGQPAGPLEITEAMVTPGAETHRVRVGEVSDAEVRTLALKLDTMASGFQNEAIAAAVIESFPMIRDAVRWVKEESKQPFRGMKGMGADLDIVWLRPQDVGAEILNPLKTTSTGLYGGTLGAVYTWLQTFTAGTADDIIPEQVMKEEAALVHIGLMSDMPFFGERTKINRAKITLSGIPFAQDVELASVNGSGLAFHKWEMPIIVGPEGKQKMELDAYITGDDRPRLMSLLIAKSEDIYATV